MITFSGDFAALEGFADRVRKAPKVLGALSEQLAEEAVELVREGFENSTDPYGKKWAAPLEMRNGRPLEDSGGLKSSWHRRRSSRNGFSIGSAKAYAIYHQQGTGIYGPRHQRIRARRARALKLPGGIFRKSVAGAPQRKMVPDTGRLPPRWAQRLVLTANEFLTEHYRG